MHIHKITIKFEHLWSTKINIYTIKRYDEIYIYVFKSCWVYIMTYLNSKIKCTLLYGKFKYIIMNKNNIKIKICWQVFHW